MGRSVGAGGVRAGVLAVLVLLLTAGCSSTPATVPAAAPTPPVPAAGRVTQKPTAPAAAASSSPRASSTPTSSSSSPTSSSSSGSFDLQRHSLDAPGSIWVVANAWRYGFVQRYPKGLQAVTGIQWEPWHYRYVGAGLARHMHATGQPVLERVFGLPPSPDYR